MKALHLSRIFSPSLNDDLYKLCEFELVWLVVFFLGVGGMGDNNRKIILESFTFISTFRKYLNFPFLVNQLTCKKSSLRYLWRVQVKLATDGPFRLIKTNYLFKTYVVLVSILITIFYFVCVHNFVMWIRCANIHLM